MIPHYKLKRTQTAFMCAIIAKAVISTMPFQVNELSSPFIIYSCKYGTLHKELHALDIRINELILPV